MKLLMRIVHGLLMSAPLEGDCDSDFVRAVTCTNPSGPNECAARRRFARMSRGGAETQRRQFEVFFSASSASPRETGGSAEKATTGCASDIADDRQRLSDVLLDFGTRVQESVFQ